jgi:hypothetical protein
MSSEPRPSAEHSILSRIANRFISILPRLHLSNAVAMSILFKFNTMLTEI